MTSDYINIDINGFYGPNDIRESLFIGDLEKKNPIWRQRPSWKWPPLELCPPFCEGHGG